jgi:hypothetical protein
LVNPTGYATQFNLDADRGYGYLSWDWIRGKETGKTELGQQYALPAAAPWLDLERWKQGDEPMQLRYVDPVQIIIIEEQEGTPGAQDSGPQNDESTAGGA